LPDLADSRWREEGEVAAVSDELVVEVEVRIGAGDIDGVLAVLVVAMGVQVVVVKMKI